jgi:crossover junction endonuclease MUS81
MIIKLDYRENKLHTILQSLINENPKNNDIQLESVNLPIGDIIIEDKDGNEKLIIERKSLKDLASSIKDNRYTEQSFRLNDCTMHNHNIVYLIEGDMSTYKPFHTRIDKKTLWSSMFSMMYYKGFSVFRSLSIEETGEAVYRFADKMRREKKTAFYDLNKLNKQEQESVQYSSVVKRVKKNNVTAENIGEIMLMQIPGISLISAQAIMQKYRTIYDLLEELNKTSSCLDTISYTTSNGKTRRLTKSCIENIQKYLMPNNIIQINTKE